MKMSFEVLNIICLPSLFIRKLISQISFVAGEEQRLENWESLPLLPCYHLRPWTCSLLDSLWMSLSSKSAICFIFITTHLNTEKYVRSICFGCHSDTPYRWLPIQSTSHYYGTNMQASRGVWINTSLNAQLLMQELNMGIESMSFHIPSSLVWGRI